MDSRFLSFLFYGFAAAWIVVVIYLITLIRREAYIRQELNRLKQMIDSGEQKHG